MHLFLLLAVIYLLPSSAQAQTSWKTQTTDGRWAVTLQIFPAAKASATRPTGDMALRASQLYMATVQVAPVGNGSLSCPSAIRFDAQMPEHNHGMSTLPRVTLDGGNSCTASVRGIYFQMSGAWLIDVDLQFGADRVRAPIDIVVAP